MRTVLHALTRSDLPDAVCEEPTGDATADLDAVTCQDCLDVIEDAEREAARIVAAAEQVTVVEVTL